jgi:hypothetical protein
LDEIGFIWDWQKHRANENWLRWFQKLKLFKERYGHCSVENDRRKNRQLVGWAASQRVLYSKGKLTEEQILQLETIGFTWDKAEANWVKRYNELLLYITEHGDCKVPTGWDVNPKLASWATTQRQLQKKRKLGTERERRLNEIGFVWANPTSDKTRSVEDEEAWMTRFNELVLYKTKHGDCRVPTKYESHPKLGPWVNNQRQRQKKGKLNAERERMLKEIGFVWANPTLETIQ